MKSDHRGIRTCALSISFCNLMGFSGGIAGKLSEFSVDMSCNTSSLHINGIPVENQESRSVKLKNLYDIFYSGFEKYFAFSLWVTLDLNWSRSHEQFCEIFGIIIKLILKCGLFYKTLHNNPTQSCPNWWTMDAIYLLLVVQNLNLKYQDGWATIARDVMWNVDFFA